MIHHYDPRWATYDGRDEARPLTDAERADPAYLPMPRYWVPRADVDARLGDWTHDHLVGWREVARNTDERTLVGAAIPRVAVGHKFQLAFPEHPEDVDLLAACFSSFVLDFVARQKLGGTAVSYFVLKQLPVPAPADVRVALADLDLRSPDRAELDARMLHLYGVNSEDAAYILDSFPIVARRETTALGEYRSRHRILGQLNRPPAPVSVDT